MALDIIIAVLLSLGIFITMIPTFPGNMYMFILTLVYALLTQFDTLPPWSLAVFGGITLLSMLIDYSSGIIGAKVGGASRMSLLIGLLGLFVGLIIFPPFGAFIGLFLGVFVAEIIQFKDEKKALKAASYSFAATIIGTIANIFLAVGFFVTFLILVF